MGEPVHRLSTRFFRGSVILKKSVTAFSPARPWRKSWFMVMGPAITKRLRLGDSESKNFVYAMKRPKVIFDGVIIYTDMTFHLDIQEEATITLCCNISSM